MIGLLVKVEHPTPMENAVRLILSILPYNIYRDFNHRFSAVQKEHDDLDFSLYVDVLPDERIRAYYYGDNSLSMAVHEEYWNGERHETFSDGGFAVDANSITQGRLESWFYRVFRLDPPSAKSVSMDGLGQKLQLIFSVLENRIMNNAGDKYELVVTVCPMREKFGIDIHYVNIATRESIWLMDGHIIEPDKVTTELLKEEYSKEVNGFTPFRR